MNTDRWAGTPELLRLRRLRHQHALMYGVSLRALVAALRYINTSKHESTLEFAREQTQADYNAKTILGSVKEKGNA